ncbi:MAG: ExbD/TolR family protein [Planctomycetota bacterium]|jgi:biopolymer transport protein ExbD
MGSSKHAWLKRREIPSLTPLVDVVFLLIVFFVLVTQIGSAQQVEMSLSRIEDSQLVDPPSEGHIVVNVMPAGGGVWCRLGPASVEDDTDRVARLVAMLGAMLESDDGMRVTVRAARDEPYTRVHDVLESCKLAGIARVHLVCEPVEG